MSNQQTAKEEVNALTTCTVNSEVSQRRLTKRKQVEISKNVKELHPLHNKKT